MQSLSISEVEVAPIRPRDGLLAFCSVLIGEQLFIGGIALHSAPPPRHYRLTYPARSIPTGQRIRFVYPITRALGDAIEQAVIQKYEDVIDLLMTDENPNDQQLSSLQSRS